MWLWAPSVVKESIWKYNIRIKEYKKNFFFLDSQINSKQEQNSIYSDMNKNVKHFSAYFCIVVSLNTYFNDL